MIPNSVHVVYVMHWSLIKTWSKIKCSCMDETSSAWMGVVAVRGRNLRLESSICTWPHSASKQHSLFGHKYLPLAESSVSMCNSMMPLKALYTTPRQHVPDSVKKCTSGMWLVCRKSQFTIKFPCVSSISNALTTTSKWASLFNGNVFIMDSLLSIIISALLQIWPC